MGKRGFKPQGIEYGPVRRSGGPPPGIRTAADVMNDPNRPSWSDAFRKVKERLVATGPADDVEAELNAQHRARLDAERDRVLQEKRAAKEAKRQKLGDFPTLPSDDEHASKGKKRKRKGKAKEHKKAKKRKKEKTKEKGKGHHNRSCSRERDRKGHRHRSPSSSSSSTSSSSSSSSSTSSSSRALSSS